MSIRNISLGKRFSLLATPHKTEARITLHNKINVQKVNDNKQPTLFHGQKMERQNQKKTKSERKKDEIEKERQKDGDYKEWSKKETMLCDPRGQNVRFTKMVAEGQ